MFPALGSKKLIGTDFENIAGDFETIADDDQARILHGQDVHLVTTEVAGSAPPESDSKFLPQMDLDFTLHYLNNSSNPQPNPILDEDSLPVRPAPTLLNGAHKSNVEPALMHSRSASPESDLEMTMPRPLSENKDLHVNSASQQRFPSTASQLDAPFTQVKRTPYVNGHVQNYRTQSLGLQSSPSKWQNFRRPPSTLSEDLTHLTASLLSSMEKSSAEAAVSEDNIHITASLLPSLENSSAEIVVAHVPKTVANDQVREDDQPAPREADEMDSAQIMKVDVDHQTSTDRVQDTVEDHITRINSADTPGQDSHNAPDATFHLIEKDINGSPLQRTSDSKRKASDSSFLSPNAVKRRKRFKVPANFNFIEDIEDHRDPSEGARRYRQEFLESRRSSECSTPIQSPTVPFASQIKAIQPNTEASSTALRCPQLIAQDHLKAAESHIKQTAIDLEDTEDTEDIPSVVDNEESMGSLEEAAASVDSMRRSDDDSFPPALEDNSQGLTTDGGRQESADGDVEGDLHMTDADMQLGMAFVDTQAIVAAVQKPSTHCEVDVDDATPGANDDQFTNLVVGAPGTEPQAIDSEALIEETPHSFSSKEVSMLQQNGSIELDPESQTLDRRELPVDSPNVPVSPSFIPNQNNYDVTALIPPPLVADTKNPLLDGQETEDLEPRLLATSSRIDSMIDEPPPTQEDISDAVRQSTAYDLARPISRLTEPTLSDIPALDADRSKQPPKLASLENVDDAPTPAPANIFERFKVAYPTYPGDVKQFVAICRKISSLIRSNRMEHQSLWDDFIIRHKIEYAQYLRQCAEDAEDPLPYEEFYRNEIEEPQYHSRIITRRNLDEVLSLIEQVSNSKKEPRKAGKSEGSQDQIDDSKRSARSEALVATPSKTSTTQVTIDLTKDDQGSNSRDMTQSTQHHVPTSNRKKTRRFIPWDELDNNGNNNSPILGLATPANTTTPRKRTISNLPRSGTLKSKRPLGSSGPLLNETHAEPAKLLSSASESLRSLKRKKSDPLVSGSTSTATTSSKMEGPPRTEAENRTDRLYESLIRGQWGVGPYEVLEPKYVGQLHQNALILLLFIARNVGLEDGRRLLMERIQRRIANSPNSPQMLTKADLKAVEEMAAGQKETNRNFRSSHREQESREMRVRGMTTLDPLSLPQADTVEEVRNESKVKEWWQDDDSPFKAFARAYASIQPGKGNSYPKKGSDKKERVENEAKEQKQIIDILGWSL